MVSPLYRPMRNLGKPLLLLLGMMGMGTPLTLATGHWTTCRMGTSCNTLQIMHISINTVLS